MKNSVILKTNFPDINLIKQGKVRDIYDTGNFYLIVSTDRLSAFDVIMNEGIPGKGRVLTQISLFWFELTSDVIENHLITADVIEYPDVCRKYEDDLFERSMLVKKAEVIPIECIVRGYLSGTGWNDYKLTGNISGIKLPAKLLESEKLPEPIFTPSTKAEIGLHDENITHKMMIDKVGKETYEILQEKSLEVYKKASDYALEKGIIIADTKFEFGYYDGKIILVDEVLTPDSSRFWSVDKYKKGKAQDSYDKQFVRDYLLSINFSKQPPPPELPSEIINQTAEKYSEALFQLTGKKLN